ncbi:MAG TPA: MlaD family protein [Beijerinckiaceae bacterium]|jgi:phospholipid/cholesterol/gamma-HCH transport system substrate-binding protein
METRANYVLVGAFTLAVVAAAFLFVFWFSGGDKSQRRSPVRIVFSGSVSGLSKGSVVTFNGLRIGEVKELSLLPEDPRRVLAIVEVDRTTPVRTDTRARLESQGLTGVQNIALIGGEPSAQPLLPGPGQPLPTIFADRSDFQDLLESARSLARRADEVLERVNKVVADNEGSIGRTITNVERFSQALSDNAPGIDRFLASVGGAAEKIGPLATKLETLATNVDELVRSVDRQRVAKIVENVDNFAQALGDNKQAINDTLKDVASLAKSLNATAPKLDTALTDFSRVAGAIDPAKVGRVVDNADKFATSLGNSSKDVEVAIKEARSITEKLNKSADRVDGVLKAAENFLGSAAGKEGQSTFGEIREAARSIRVLADNLDKRTAEITQGVTRFTGSGLREVEAFASDGRRTLNEINRTVRGIERNPQQFLFGGKPNIPEYNGRR